MTIDEWAATATLLLRRWPNQSLDTDVLSTWFELLADLPGEAVHAAVRAIALTSRQFPPNPGDIREKFADLAAPPVTFEQAWAEANRAISAAGRYNPAKAERLLRQVSGAWDLVLAMGGWDEFCNGGPAGQSPVPAGVRRAEGEHAWKALREQRRTDVAAAPLVGPAGEAARDRLQGDAVRRIAIDDRPALDGPQRLELPSAADLVGGPVKFIDYQELKPPTDRERVAARLDALPPDGRAHWHGQDGRPCVCEECMPRGGS